MHEYIQPCTKGGNYGWHAYEGHAFLFKTPQLLLGYVYDLHDPIFPTLMVLVRSPLITRSYFHQNPYIDSGMQSQRPQVSVSTLKKNEEIQSFLEMLISKTKLCRCNLTELCRIKCLLVGFPSYCLLATLLVYNVKQRLTQSDS